MKTFYAPGTLPYDFEVAARTSLAREQMRVVRRPTGEIKMLVSEKLTADEEVAIRPCNLGEIITVHLLPPEEQEQIVLQVVHGFASIFQGDM